MHIKILLFILGSVTAFNIYATDKAEKSKTPFEAPIKGKVLEKMNVASYTYLKLKTETDETWVAVPQLEIALNTEVELQKPIPMFGFESKTLKRKFDRIYFGVLKSQKEAKEKARGLENNKK
jgi:hypothetical protein